MVADLTGMPLSNCSLLDEATAAAEAMTMCTAQSRQKKLTFLVSVSSPGLRLQQASCCGEAAWSLASLRSEFCGAKRCLAGTNDCLLHGFLETPRPACCSMKWGGASLLRTHTSCCSARAHIEQQGGL